VSENVNVTSSINHERKTNLLSATDKTLLPETALLPGVRLAAVLVVSAGNLQSHVVNQPIA
jgi:hypothetical protein